MKARAFLDVADELATGAHEGHWRSAISRAYYAAFHSARSLFEHCGFTVPRAERCHAYLSLRLTNSGHPDIGNAGVRPGELRRDRNSADYDLKLNLDDSEAIRALNEAVSLIQVFEDALINAPLLARVTQAMRDYERDVLQDVTWRGP